MLSWQLLSGITLVSIAKIRRQARSTVGRLGIKSRTSEA